MKLAIRLYIESELADESTMEASIFRADDVMEEIALRHFRMAGDRRYMTEIEFLDEPNHAERFARFGNWADPRMHEPTGIDLDDETVGPIKRGRWTKTKLV